MKENPLKPLCHQRLVIGLVVLLTLHVAPAPAADRDVVVTALAALPVHRGWAVIFGGTAEQAVALAANSEFTVLAQMSDAKEAERLRQAALEKKWLGIRVYVETGVEKCLLADHLADLAIALDPKTPESEVLRVISPLRGRGFAGGRMIAKPVSPGSDEWTHRSHSADNNQTSTDTVFQLPAMMQYLATPSWIAGIFPAGQIAGSGVMITITMEMDRSSSALPHLWRIMAHSLYNGTILWKRDVEIDGGFVPTAPLYALISGRLYLTAGKSCAASVIDAETGKDVATIAPVAPSHKRLFWLGVDNGRLGMLLGNINSAQQATRSNRISDKAAVEGSKPGGDTLAVWDLQSNREVFRHEEAEGIDCHAVAMRNGKVFFYSSLGHQLNCLDETGKTLWENKDIDSPRKLPDYASDEPFDRLFVGPAGQLCLTFRQGTKSIYNATDGKLLWCANAHDPLDALTGHTCFVGNRYFAGGMSNNQAAFFDAQTGAFLEKTSLPGFGCETASWVEGMKSGLHTVSFCGKNPCLTLPPVADGILVHMTTHCRCMFVPVRGVAGYIAGKEILDRAEKYPVHPLEIGNAPAPVLTARPGDWVAYRGDYRHQGCVSIGAGKKAHLLWTRPARQPFLVKKDYHELDGESFWKMYYTYDWLDRPTAPVTAGGLVFFGATDGGVQGIRLTDGTVAWRFETGGAVLTSPVFADGRLLVGSADGWVYCLNAADGKLAWRWRGAPVERRLPIVGKLFSSWPVMGILVKDGAVYGAAGAWCQNGVLAFALNLSDGTPRWQTWTGSDPGNFIALGPFDGPAFGPSGGLTVIRDNVWICSELSLPALFNTATGARVAWPLEYARDYKGFLAFDVLRGGYNASDIIPVNHCCPKRRSCCRVIC